jgi:uncharacterized protein YjbJ (UPF0337 family)
LGPNRRKVETVFRENQGKLTDDDLTMIRGKRERLVGKSHQRYGLAKEQVERQIDEFTRPLRESESRHQASKTRGAS